LAHSGFDNPSLPFPIIIQKLSENNVTFAIAPNTGDEQLTAEAQQLQAYLEQVRFLLCGKVLGQPSLTRVIAFVFMRPGS
jgi:hypothetical protein